MANTQGYFGLRPVKTLSGQVWDGATGKYTISTGYATSLFTGDAVTLSADGTIIAAGTSPVLGVFMGCEYVDAAGRKKFSPYWDGLTTHTAISAYVADDPNIVCQIQVDGMTFALTDVGTRGDFAPGTGSTSTGRSGGFIDTLVTTAAQLGVLRLAPTVGNEVGAYATVEVFIAEHFNRTAAGI